MCQKETASALRQHHIICISVVTPHITRILSESEFSAIRPDPTNMSGGLLDVAVLGLYRSGIVLVPMLQHFSRRWSASTNMLSRCYLCRKVYLVNARNPGGGQLHAPTFSGWLAAAAVDFTKESWNMLQKSRYECSLSTWVLISDKNSWWKCFFYSRTDRRLRNHRARK